MGRLSRLKVFLSSLKGNRTALLSFAALVVFALSVFLIGFLPQLTAPETTLNAQGEIVPLDSVTRSQLENDIRGTWAAITGGFVILLGVIAAFWRASATERNVHVLQEGQITERFTRAIEHLGSDNTAICLGGIYALERIAKDSPENDHRQVMEVLTAYVRENARWPQPAKGSGDIENRSGTPSTVIHAILTVLARRNTEFEKPGDRLDLSHTDLRKLNVNDLSFFRFDFTESHLEESLFIGAHFEDTSFSRSHLQNSDFSAAHLVGIDFYQANLKGASLSDAELAGTEFLFANLEGAHLNASLNGTIFSGAHLEGAYFDYSNGLSPEQLDRSYWDEHTIFPKGFEPPQMRQD